MTQERKSKLGRPKVPEAKSRSVFISTRLSPNEYQEISMAVRQSGKKKSDWLRAALLDKARCDFTQ